MPIPERIGKYLIRGALGTGAMGSVYEGFDASIERRVAIKTILAEHLAAAQSLGAVARFKHEAQAAGRLHHPAIVGVYEYGEDDEMAFIVMEYVEGQSLDKLMLERGRFAAIDIYEVMKQLLAALDHAHRNGVVHCDIKPANVMVLKDMRIKLMDFGVARIENSTQTQAGVTRGTPTHIAPEQYSGQPTDGRADLWAAGVILYELLTGRGPFVAETPAAVMHQVMNLTPPAPSSLAAGLPQAFDALLARALAKKPDQRFQSAREFAAALVSAFVTSKSPADGGAAKSSAAEAPSHKAHAAKAWSLPPDTLASIERALSRAIGPIARHLAHKSALRARDVEEFYALLADNVPAGAERNEFIAHLERLDRAGAALPPMFDKPVAGFDPATLVAAEMRLAQYVGPLAETLIMRAAHTSSDVGELYRQLAEYIDSPQERAAFLKSIP